MDNLSRYEESCSNNEVDKLGTVLVSLVSEDAEEDGEDDIVGDIRWVLDDLISDQEDNSNILEAVGGQEEGDSGSLDSIAQLGLDFVSRVA